MSLSLMMLNRDIMAQSDICMELKSETEWLNLLDCDGEDILQSIVQQWNTNVLCQGKGWHFLS